MNRQKKLVILPKLHDYNSDISRQWFVFFSYRNPASGKMKRFRIYEGFTQVKSLEEKTAFGLELVEKLRQKLLNGWSPFDDDPVVVFNDSLRYRQVAKKYGRQRQANKRFAYYTNHWLNSLAGIRPSTYTTYKSKLRYFNEFLDKQGVAENDITEFDRGLAREFQQYLKKDRKLSYKSINEYNVLMRAFFKWLIDERLLKENPFEGIKAFKTETKKPRIYPQELIQKVSSVASQTDPQLLLAIRIIYNCFIRPGELRQLMLSDIDFSRGKITVPATVAKDKTERSVDLPLYILDQMIALGFNKLPRHWFLISRVGKPGPRAASRNFLYKRFVKLKKTANIPKEYILYAFKHTGMVELKLSGADWLEVRNQAGHESLDQTIEYTMELMKSGSRHIREKAPRI